VFAADQGDRPVETALKLVDQLAAVLILYWAYDRIVGIDNVKLG